MDVDNKLLRAVINFFVTIALLTFVYLILIGLSSFEGKETAHLIRYIPEPTVNEFFDYVKSRAVFYLVVFVVFLILTIAGFYDFYDSTQYANLREYIKQNFHGFLTAIEALVVSLILHIFVCYGWDFTLAQRIAVFIVIWASTLILVLWHYRNVKGKQPQIKSFDFFASKILVFFLIFIFILAKNLSPGSIYSSIVDRVEEFFAVYVITYIIAILLTGVYDMATFSFFIGMLFIPMLLVFVLGLFYIIPLIIFKFSLYLKDTDFIPLYVYLNFVKHKSAQLFMAHNYYDFISIFMIVASMSQFIGKYEQKLEAEDISIYADTNFTILTIIGVLVAIIYIIFSLKSV